MNDCENQLLCFSLKKHLLNIKRSRRCGKFHVCAASLRLQSNNFNSRVNFCVVWRGRTVFACL